LTNVASIADVKKSAIIKALEKFEDDDLVVKALTSREERQMVEYANCTFKSCDRWLRRPKGVRVEGDSNTNGLKKMESARKLTERLI